MLETSVYPRETESLKELRNKTETHSSWINKTSSSDVGQFLKMILKLINAKNTMQIGIQSGYVLSTALAIPNDGKEKYHGAFDLIYLDVHKTICSAYHTTLIDLVRIGGVIVYDKTLLSDTLGTLRIVSDEDASGTRYYGDPVLLFNEKVASDPRVEICQVPVGIGVTLCRRIRLSAKEEIKCSTGCSSIISIKFRHLFYFTFHAAYGSCYGFGLQCLLIVVCVYVSV
ncbi:caffeoyl-CoA O-methyltransferase-like [Olea europaea var. sylvestris]|uniref:caffeoyl-CoA O-methyltransferase-like n=1 Tax=Olea europaea var. sylvestris TaxID=158386 RepID=UPI000C1D805F|nr:caffeoyl-CoA O-methyltransferase-like [Olea europaea var. sylvestris]